MINGRRAIVIGLLGLDSEHGAYTELHPVYGLAIQVNDNPNDDQWAVMVRNCGDEGFCSEYQTQLPVESLAFFIPRANSNGASIKTNEVYSNKDSTLSVETKPGGAVVTFSLGPPEQGTLIHGLLHISWQLSGGHPVPAGGHLLPAVEAPAAPHHASGDPDEREDA
jgi:hypothetical protein